MQLGIEYGLAHISMVGDQVHFPAVLFESMAADDVASGVARIAAGPPVHGIVGCEGFRVEQVRRGAWPRSTILANSSLTQMRVTTEQGQRENYVSR